MVGEKVSRADLCVDLALPFPEIDLTKEVVTRARTKINRLELDKVSSGTRSTYYRIGSGGMLARIYNKSEEIKVSHKEWFKEIWLSQGWDGFTPVTRFEFQLRREVLKDYSVNTFDELQARLADIWLYCTQRWLTIRDVNPKDTERSRWPIKDYWLVVQSAIGHFGKCWGMLRYKEKQNKYEHIEKLLRGVLISAVAILSSYLSEYGAFSKVKLQVNTWLDSDEFLTEVRERRAKMSKFSP